MRLRFSAATAAALTLLASPALAQDRAPEAPPMADAPGAPTPYGGGPRYAGYDPAAREAWLADCHQRVAARDSGVGGAVIGGVVGGIAGNRIAGRRHRAVGTIAGAAVGAVAGAAIDRAEDAGRNRGECEAYLDDYYARYTQGGAYYPGYGYGYGNMAQPMMMVPVPQAQPHCTETVEYVYEDVPVRPAPKRRYIPRRTKIVPDKRVKIVPDKQIKTK